MSERVNTLLNTCCWRSKSTTVGLTASHYSRPHAPQIYGHVGPPDMGISPESQGAWEHVADAGYESAPLCVFVKGEMQLR